LTTYGGQFFYAKAAPHKAVSLHTRDRMITLLNTLLTPFETPKEAQRLIGSALRLAARQCWSDKLLTDGGAAAADTFGRRLAPTARAAGALGEAIVAAEATSPTLSPRRKARRSESKGGAASADASPRARRRSRGRSSGGQADGVADAQTTTGSAAKP